MKFLKIIRSRIVIFIIQFAILSIFLIIFNYNFQINFDITISEERKQIIQVIANYIMFGSPSEIIFIFGIWLLIATLPVLIYRQLKRVYSMNILSFFFPNFFFYVFLSRYSPNYFNANFGVLIVKTLILGAILMIYSIFLFLILKWILKKTKKEESIKIQEIENKVTFDCPKCGTHFDSRPIYCYNCNTKLIEIEDDTTKNSKI